MEYRDLVIKNTDGSVRELLKVSRICFGSLCLGHLQSNLEIGEGARVLRHAYECGINFFDTAQLYKTYKYIKAAGLGTKTDVIISSKTYAYTRNLAENALEEALSEIGRDYIDIFMLHEQESINTIEGHLEALEYLFEQKEHGRIKALGVSTHHISGVFGAIQFNGKQYANERGYRLDVIHPMYNMIGIGIVDGTRKEMEAALLEAKKSGFFIFGMKALGGGVLYNQAEDALRFAFSKPFIDSVAIGMKSVLEVDANIKFLQTGKFPKEYHTDYRNIKKSLHIDDWCASCGECVSKCGQSALKITADGVACDDSKCILCGYCASACKDFAIKII